MSESEKTRILCAELRKHNAFVTVLHGGAHRGQFDEGARAYQQPGLPDRHIAHNYLPGGVWVEFKDETGLCKPEQKLWIRENSKRGVNAFVARHPGKSWPMGFIENEEGRVYSEWDGTAGDLIAKLKELISE